MTLKQLFFPVLLILISAEGAFPIIVSSTPKTEIAEGQFYQYHLIMDKNLPFGSFVIIQKPGWLNFNESSRVFSGIADSTYGPNSTTVRIIDGIDTLNYTFVVQIRHLHELPKIVTHYVDPVKYPEFKRRKYPTPTWATFNDTVQFVAGRYLHNFYWENLDSRFGAAGDRPVAPRWFTGNGKVFRPGLEWFGSLSGNPATDTPFKTAMIRLKQQGIYLFNIGGYGPGSPIKGSFGMFKLPDSYRDSIQSILGDKFLGFDVGEQDGRYLFVMNQFNRNNTSDRFQSYLNFHNYIQRISDDQGNKLSLLTVSWGSHYQAKNNTVYILGAESQPKKYVTSHSVNYMMLRGAARTYGLPLFGDVSVYSSCGENGTGNFKAYGSGYPSDGGPIRGNSLGLMRRMMFSQYLYNAVILGFEGGQYPYPWLSTQQESPIAEVQRQMVDFVQSNPKAGVMHSPVAVLQDYFSGWIPKGNFSPIGGQVSDFGTIPWDFGDWQTHYVISKIYPSYDQNGLGNEELGGICNTPFGDMADGILTDVSKEILTRYGLVICSGLLRNVDQELRDKVQYYLNQGGNLVVTGRNALALFPQWLNADDSWITVTKPEVNFYDGTSWSTLNDSGSFLVKDKLSLPEGYAVLAYSIVNGQNRPFIVRINAGKGSIIIVLSEFGLNTASTEGGLLPSYSNLLSLELAKQQLFKIDNDHLSFVTNRIDSATYTLGIFNNSLKEQSFQIQSKIGTIQSINEQDLTMGRSAISTQQGYWPQRYQNNDGGNNTANTIMGSDVRFFKIRVNNDGLFNASDSLNYAKYPLNRYLYFPSLINLQQKILEWNTVLAHFEGVMIDWDQIMTSDKVTLLKNATWLNLQNLKLVVDFSRGFDEYFKPLAQDISSGNDILLQLENVFGKMRTVFGDNAKNVLFKIPSSDLVNSEISGAIGAIVKKASVYGIEVLIYPGKGESDTRVLSILDVVHSSNPNVKYLLNTANFSNIQDGMTVAGKQLGAVLITPENSAKSYLPIKSLDQGVLQIYDFNLSSWDSVYNVISKLAESTIPILIGSSSSTKPQIRDISGEITDNYKADILNANYLLTFRNASDIRQEILSIADTVFAYFGGVMIEANYLASRDSLALANDKRWLKAKGLKVVVDLSQELNNFPDLSWYIFPLETGRLSNYYRMVEQQDYMRKVIDKMKIIGADNIIIGGHNGPENSNGYTTNQFPGIESFVAYAKSKGIIVHYQNNEFNNYADGLSYNEASKVANFVDTKRKEGVSNLYFASNSINRHGFYYPSNALLGLLVIGGSGSSVTRVPQPIHSDSQINVSAIINHPNSLKILDGGYEADKSSFASNAGTDARYLKRTKRTVVNHKPQITSTPVAKVGTGNFNYTITASDPDGDNLYFRKVHLPSWLNFDASTHVISGFVPDNMIGKTFSVKILVGDGTTEVAAYFDIRVDTSVGIDPKPTEKQNEQVYLYPNPAKDYTTVHLSNKFNRVRSIQLTGIDGRVIRNIVPALSDDQIKISLVNISNQIVLVHLVFIDGYEKTLKLIVLK